jgi:hypothetical protein
VRRRPLAREQAQASVMIEKFVIISGEAANEFLDLNHTSKL